MPHRLEEYSNRFLEARDRAFRNLETTLQEEESMTTTTTTGRLQLGISPLETRSFMTVETRGKHMTGLRIHEV
jgi:hypothetical protein